MRKQVEAVHNIAKSVSRPAPAVVVQVVQVKQTTNLLVALINHNRLCQKNKWDGRMVITLIGATEFD